MPIPVKAMDKKPGGLLPSLVKRKGLSKPTYSTRKQSSPSLKTTNSLSEDIKKSSSAGSQTSFIDINQETNKLTPLHKAEKSPTLQRLSPIEGAAKPALEPNPLDSAQSKLPGIEPSNSTKPPKSQVEVLKALLDSILETKKYKLLWIRGCRAHQLHYTDKNYFHEAREPNAKLDEKHDLAYYMKMHRCASLKSPFLSGYIYLQPGKSYTFLDYIKKDRGKIGEAGWVTISCAKRFFECSGKDYIPKKLEIGDVIENYLNPLECEMLRYKYLPKDDLICILKTNGSEGTSKEKLRFTNIYIDINTSIEIDKSLENKLLTLGLKISSLTDFINEKKALPAKDESTEQSEGCDPKANNVLKEE